MSVFHRVEDIYTMRADLFFRRAVCLAAYDGAVAARRDEQVELAAQDVRRRVQPAPATTEDQLWEAHRQKHYAKFLAPGERISEVGVDEFMSIMSQPAMGG